MRRAWAVGLSAAVLALAASTAARADQSSAPWATADASSAPLGATVHVQGGGWGPAQGDTVDVVLCGNAALDGSSDCAVDNVAEGAVGADGQFVAGLRLLAPPYPCPCVLRVSTPNIEAVIAIPISVVGFATAAPTKQVHISRAVVVDQVQLEGQGPWLAWFGGGPTRTLVYRVTNSGDVVLHSPAVSLTWGKGTSPSGLLAAPDVGDLAPGQSKTFRVRLALPGFSIGTYHAVVQVDPLGTIGRAQASTLSLPYGLISLALVGLGFLVRRWRQRRRQLRQFLRAAGGAGWYLDPLGGDELRLWSGVAWTERVRPILPSDHPVRLEPEGASAEPNIFQPDAADFTVAVAAEAEQGSPAPVLVEPAVFEPDGFAPERVGAGTVSPSEAEPGWYADPLAEDRLRLWTGSAWTDDTQTRETAGAGAD
jgi:hypothetical protein